MGLSEINQELLANELQNVIIELRNCGSTALHNIVMSSSLPHLFSLSSATPVFSNNTSDDSTSDNPPAREREIRKNHVIPITLPTSFNGRLEPGQSHTINLWLRAPSSKGTALVDLMFYYENVNINSIPR